MAIAVNKMTKMPSFLPKQPWRKLKTSINVLRALSTDYSNQSRGSLPRFFSPTIPSPKGGVVRVQGDEFWHMSKVLRLGVNDRIELFNGKGCLVEGAIEKVDRTGLDFVAVRDSIVCILVNRNGMYSQLLELGASSITPLLTERSPLISENRVDRLQRVILAATKQCQRLHEMTLNPPMKIHGIAPMVARSKLSFVAVAEATLIISTLKSSVIEARGTLIIGPEGDFIGRTENDQRSWRYRSWARTALPATIKSKANALKKPKKKKSSSTKSYINMDKSASVKVEIRRRKARQLIDKTLKIADRPGKLSL
ncbi:hypothetical protein RND81_14G192100 [Saponaria officinalis]|uniref:16S rRNA (uracil(1498)-N(3))-methyltransferase n=1 Tax=Saponaria officinalis TaxID=3572 RepID=A0AAW1GRP2_SAPOF